LLDGLGNQFSTLSLEAFKELYPTSTYHQYEYSFIFNRYYIDTSDEEKRQKIVKTLFKGGNIYPNVKIECIIPFQRISESAKEITLILPDIILYNELYEDTPEKDIEFKFKFRQKVIRLKD
jgi:hypothetical protein